MGKTNSIYKNGEGGYIFISHSHLDIQKVRIIRNTLEENGYEPLCFYLKCLNDNDEIEGLIKREIDSRDIFLYIESENSKNSGWVQKERNYINNCKNKTIYKIVLKENTDLKKETEEILRKTRVFISYSIFDEFAYKILKEKLINQDLKVFDFKSAFSSNADIFARRIVESIKFASKEGCFVLIISENGVQSAHVRKELEFALKYSEEENTIIPIVLDNALQSKSGYIFKYLLGNRNYIKVNNPKDKNEWDKVVEAIKTVLINKIIN